MNDPSTETWRATFAASGQLRQTQQADLTAMQAERDALAVLNAELKAEAKDWRERAARHLTALGETTRALATVNFRNRILTAELDAALRRLNETETGGAR